MRSQSQRRVVAALVAALLGTLIPGLSMLARAQTPGECTDANAPTPEENGPTDISAVSGNQALSVAVNPAGTVTVMKWPSPSFYDQIKYRTTDRSLPRFGALPNEGAFIGLAWQKPNVDKKENPWGFSWLRNWSHSQRFADDNGDEIMTRYRKSSLGLTVTLHDVVVHDRDIFLRRVTVARSRSSRIRRVRLVAFSNFNPVVTKDAQQPFQDWCAEEQNDAGAEYIADLGAVVHERIDIDQSTGQERSVALMLALGVTPGSFHVGDDSYENGGTGSSAYDDAADGKLTKQETAVGQADAALSQDLSLRKSRRAQATVIIAAANDRQNVTKLVRAARDIPYTSWRNDKAVWWKDWLKPADLPKNAPASVTRLAKRSLISLRQAIDKRTHDIDDEGVNIQPGDLVVASVATQSPYGLDWVRNGAYLNYALNSLGRKEIVKNHNLRYAVLQHKAGDQMRGGSVIQPGNWSQNFYADGVVGGSIQYEIDETGFGMWTLWNHYEFTGDRNYLISEAIYEALQRSAVYLTDTCRDPLSGLQCPASEGDNATATQGLRGAMMVWKGLDSAARAARIRATETSLLQADQWEARRDELGAAIEANFLDADCNCYTSDYQNGGILLWPVQYLRPGSVKANAQADMNWDQLRPSFNGERVSGGHEAWALLGNAHVWAGQPDKLRLVKKGLVWVAQVPTSDETGILGEAWMHYPEADSPVVTMVSQPHVVEQIIFYLAALKAYGKAPYTFK